MRYYKREQGNQIMMMDYYKVIQVMLQSYYGF